MRIQRDFSRFHSFSLINRLYEFLLVFAGYIFQRIADLVDDTKLDFGLGKDRVDRLWKAREAIDTSNQDVLQAAIVQVRQHREPEVCTFGFR